jgi:NTE family protein
VAERKLDAVFEGGGVRGIALVGAVAVIEEAGYAFENLAGTSAGAIVSTLLAAGYRAAEIRAIAMELDLNRLADSSPVGRIPILGPIVEAVTGLGIYKGDELLGILRDLLAARGVRTFGDLVIPGQSDPRYRFRARVVASDLTRGRLLALPQDIEQYGMRPEDLEVALAVRMSGSTPFIFKPVRLRDPAGETHVIVDGALLSNYPLELFDSPGIPAWPTFGFRLVQPGAPPFARFDVRGPISYVMAMIGTAMEAHDQRYVEQHNFARTIAIDGLGVSGTDFSISAAEKEKLYASGVAAARKFMAGWDFRAYCARWRSGASA